MQRIVSRTKMSSIYIMMAGAVLFVLVVDKRNKPRQNKCPVVILAAFAVLTHFVWGASDISCSVSSAISRVLRGKWCGTDR